MGFTTQRKYKKNRIIRKTTEIINYDIFKTRMLEMDINTKERVTLPRYYFETPAKISKQFKKSKRLLILHKQITQRLSYRQKSVFISRSLCD